MLKLGNKNITKLYYGDKAISKAYYGDKLVYNPQPLFLDYVIFDGASWIDTGYKPNPNTSATCTYYPYYNTVFSCIFGTQDSVTSNRFYGVLSSTLYRVQVNSCEGNLSYYGISSSGLRTGSNGDFASLQEKVALTIDNYNKQISVVSNELTKTYDTETYSTQYHTPNCKYNLLLGNRSTAGEPTTTNGFKGEIYGLQIKESDVLIQDLRPCIHPNGTVCFYDMVTKRYFYNQGTGTLKAGGRFVKSIIFYGASYIDTGIIPSNNMEFEAGVMFSVVQSTNLSIIASRDGEKRYQPIGAIQNKWSSSIGGMYDSNGSPVSANIRYDLRSVVSNGDSISLYSGDTLVSSATSSGGIPTKSLYLFARNFSPIDSYVTGESYYNRIKENSVLIQDLRPYVDSGGVACFKDVVTNMLHYGQGAGTLGYT